jgi:hypothetical protein
LKHNSFINVSKNIIHHTSLSTVTPSYTNKRNEPYKILDRLCDHKKHKNYDDFNGYFNYIKKGEGSSSVW